MNLYVVNMLSDKNGSHAIHKYGCPEFPNIFFEVGMYNSTQDAVRFTTEMLKNVHCCRKCIPIETIAVKEQLKEIKPSKVLTK